MKYYKEKEAEKIKTNLKMTSLPCLTNSRACVGKVVVRLQVSADVKPYVPASRIILLTSVFASTSGRENSFLYLFVGKLHLSCKGLPTFVLIAYILNIFIFHECCF